MSREASQSSSPAELRERAEAKVGTRVAPSGSLSLEESQRLIHDLEVHQVELDMQNEDLRQSRHDLEESRNRYAELYDFAPVGYVTLDAKGKILEINLTLSTLLMDARAQLARRDFADFVDPYHKETLEKHLRECQDSDRVTTTELTLVGVQGYAIPAQLQSVRTESSQWGPVYQTAVVDLAARKAAEEELRRLNVTLETRVLERTAEAEAREAQLRILAEELTPPPGTSAPRPLAATPGGRADQAQYLSPQTPEKPKRRLRTGR
jgi:PAS domain S-box-containing protein